MKILLLDFEAKLVTKYILKLNIGNDSLL